MKRWLIVLMTFAACSSPMELDAGEVVDAGAFDAGIDDAGVFDAGTKADNCAFENEFGALFTNAFGRADGTVVAVVPPAWPCPFPNSDHVVIQMMIDGGVQRLVVNVKSDFGNPNIFMRELNAPLPAPAYGEGWHPGLSLDYPTDFDVHTTDGGWDEVNLEQASARIDDAITIGAPLSVYATSSGGSYAASAHKIHRNSGKKDGAIVIDPTGANPRWLLFRFANQSF